MPSRWLREGILTSERVNRLNAEAEVLFRRLLSVVDDYGRYYATPALIRAACYPLMLDRVREADIARRLAEVQAAGLLVLYRVGNTEYLELFNTGWIKRSKPKFPGPPEACVPPGDPTKPPGDPSNTTAEPCGDAVACDDASDETEPETAHDVTPMHAECLQSARSLQAESNGIGIRSRNRNRKSLDDVRASTHATKPPTAKRFTPPTLEEVAAYCRERRNTVNPQRFLDHYEANGWKVGRNPMKDWRAAVRTWEQNHYGREDAGSSPLGREPARSGGGIDFGFPEDGRTP